MLFSLLQKSRLLVGLKSMRKKKKKKTRNSPLYYFRVSYLYLLGFRSSNALFFPSLLFSKVKKESTSFDLIGQTPKEEEL